MKIQRPPIVTVLGHVDHGKTTLLDAIRKSNIAGREAGGITQGTSASVVETKEGRITFIDTPGHAAFSKMRARGTKVADIAVLVVATDDGVMPQTREALSYIKENKIPLIVAFTKMDLPSSNVERARGQLMEEEVFFEGLGGQTPSVEISSKTGKGVAELLEIIYLLSGVSDIDGDPKANLLAFVVETNKDKRGTVVSVVVKNGQINIGDEISAEGIVGKVKGLFSWDGKPLKAALPGDPAAVLGFTKTPEAGAKISAGRPQTEPSSEGVKGRKKVSEGEFAVLLKAQKAGSLEAIEASLPKGAIVLSSAVGDITESDVFFAKTSDAIIISFEAGIPAAVKRLADTEGVEIVSFKIIYELLEFVQKRIIEGKVDILGRAEISAEFPFNKTKVAGAKVLEGRIQNKDKITLMRGNEKLGSANISSMRREKADLSEAKAGEECGIILTPPLNFQKGDILVATKK